jgi:hypothetical protein
VPGEQNQMMISFILLPGEIPWGKGEIFFAWVEQIFVHTQNLKLIYYQE